MRQPLGGDDETSDLAAVERELTQVEQERLMALAEEAWRDIVASFADQARAAYSVAPREAFALCVGTHMNRRARQSMLRAEVYHCPVCGRLLKDRHTTAASSILLERRRLRELWREVQRLPSGPERDSALRKFVVALGED